jgi:LAO/AO transport system kinase
VTDVAPVTFLNMPEQDVNQTQIAKLTEEVLAGNIRAVSQILTRVEAGDNSMEASLDRIYCSTGMAHVIGVTGVPGAGKSTLIALLATEFRKSHDKVGIIAVDPSSALTGGAILGDRVRMISLTHDKGIFIRSMATRGSMGGLALATHEAIDVLDAAGFGIIMVETVGVGQDEFEITDAVDTTVVVSAPGLGDDVQAIKAGILEMADIHVINKADKPEAHKTIRDIQAMLSITGSRRRSLVPVLPTSAETGEGIHELVGAIGKHLIELRENGGGEKRYIRRCKQRVLRAAEQIVSQLIKSELDEKASTIFKQVYLREKSPRAAAREFIKTFEF